MPRQKTVLARRWVRQFVLAAAVCLTGTSTAHAYIDPGTGSMILQLLAAAVAGALFYARRWRSFLSNWIFRRKAGPDSGGETRTEREPPG